MTSSQTNRPPHQGRVKFFKIHEGYGFLTCALLPRDVYVHARVIQEPEPLGGGDLVAFRCETGTDGRIAATRVKLITPARTLDGRQPYFGRPTKFKDEVIESLSAGQMIGGAAGMLLLGPFGLIGTAIGMLLGGSVGRSIEEAEGKPRPPPIIKKGTLITQTCLRCNSVMHVSSITEERVGYQCIRCGRLFTVKNDAALKAEHVELAVPEI